MSDRFYAQMADHFDMAPWELSIALQNKESPQYKVLERKAMPKVTRKDVAKSINEILGKSLDIGKLSLPSLTVIEERVRSKKVIPVELPEGRLKQPYYEAVHTALQLGPKESIELTQITVATLKLLIEALNETSNIL